MLSQSDNDRGGPREEAASNVVATDIHIVTAVADIVRCRDCGHVIWSDLSIKLGVGAECRRRAA